MLISTYKTRFIWLLLCLPCWLALSGCDSPQQRLLKETGQKVIVPMHLEFANQTDALWQASQHFCQQPQSSEAFVATQQAWLAAMSAWQGVQMLQFGPIMVDNQAWKVQFWPDKKNLVAKKTKQLLAEVEPITLQRLREASVVLQGLSLVEYLLFDAQLGQAALTERHCQLLLAATEQSHEVAKGLFLAWAQGPQAFLRKWGEPGPKNKDYPSELASMTSLVGSLVYGMERIQREKMAGPLGQRNRSGKGKPYLAETWRSQTSLTLIVANLAAAQRLFDGGEGYGLEDYLREHNQAALAEQISTQFQQLNRDLQAIEQPMFVTLSAAIRDPAKMDTLLAHYQELLALLHLLKEPLPKALGVTLGFNANDGD